MGEARVESREISSRLAELTTGSRDESSQEAPPPTRPGTALPRICLPVPPAAASQVAAPEGIRPDVPGWRSSRRS